MVGTIYLAQHCPKLDGLLYLILAFMQTYCVSSQQLKMNVHASLGKHRGARPCTFDHQSSSSSFSSSRSLSVYFEHQSSTFQLTTPADLLLTLTKRSRQRTCESTFPSTRRSRRSSRWRRWCTALASRDSSARSISFFMFFHLLEAAASTSYSCHQVITPTTRGP